ncbi:MAG TPA: hypothetical protein VFE92_11145 [Dermatophilaceae bacterium]|nr:hypothetical protein [Dermatophilaceae bacterium]
MSCQWVQHGEGVAHPADADIVLGTVTTTGHRCDAVVSLYQRGIAEVPLAGNRAQDHIAVMRGTRVITVITNVDGLGARFGP